MTPALSSLESTNRDCRSLSVNPDLWYLVSGALDYLSREENWEQFGTATPEETAEFFLALWDDFIMSRCAHIGELRAFSFNPPPDKWLVLDGSTYDSDDYPELAAVIPSSWLDNGTFTLPDMAGTGLVGSGTAPVNSYTLGDTGGEEEHTLVTSEIPAHTHTYTAPVISSIDLAGELPDGINVQASPTNTGSTGGGNAHNNMPLYLVITWAIYAGV